MLKVGRGHPPGVVPTLRVSQQTIQIPPLLVSGLPPYYDRATKTLPLGAYHGRGCFQGVRPIGVPFIGRSHETDDIPWPSLLRLWYVGRYSDSQMTLAQSF